MLVVYDWLKDYVGKDAPSVGDIEDLLTFHAFEIDGVETVGDDTIIDVKVLPDRSGDSLSHRGIAREIATLTGKPLASDPFATPPVLTQITNRISVSIEDPLLCRRFGMALVTGVKIQESPEWLKRRLNALGQRSINNVVDATNYVMLALGQPLHAYDGDIFPHADGVWRFGVRKARVGEKITTLTNDEYELSEHVQLIVDASNDTGAGIAGIKGGKYAEVTGATKTIILEAANFEPSFTRKASQWLKLQTDASKRFENNVSPEVSPYALAECVRLILEIAEGTCEGYVDMYPTPIMNGYVQVTLAHTNALLGLSLTTEEVENILSRLGFTFTKENEGWSVLAPFERRDIAIAEDVIAEIGRVYGYNHVTSVVPEAVPLTEYNNRHVYSEQIRSILTGLGFSEVITSSFRDKDTICLQNALASDKGCLRSSLQENMKEVLDKNISNVDLLGITALKIFEIGTVFTKDEGKGVVEHMSLALGVRIKQQGYSPKDDALLTEVIATVRTALGVSLQITVANGIAECNLTELITELPEVHAYVPAKSNDVTFKPFSTYPFVTRDIALWVPEATAPEIVQSTILNAAGPLCVRITQFDAFKKDGRVSYAFRLVFQSYKKTLSDEEMTPTMEKITEVVTKEGWEVR